MERQIHVEQRFLTTPKYANDISVISKDTGGRRIFAKLDYQDTCFTICNIYAPNQDNPEFFVETFHEGFEKYENTIYIGDFNVVTDISLDRKGEKCNNKKACQIINASCADMYLNDVWRTRNPGVQRFSYFRKNPKMASRIDYALVPQGIDSKIASCFYVPCTMTDHSAFFMSIACQKGGRGPGYWKFNDMLIEDPKYVDMLEIHLKNKLNEYSQMGKREKWEMIKFEIANQSQQWSRNKASEKRFILSQLYEKLEEIQQKSSQELSERNIDLMERTQEDINNLELEHAKGILFRCKARWQVEAERNTAYFYGLEKSKYNSKTCSSLLHKGTVVRDQRKILQLQKEFYANLYKRDPNVNFKKPNIEGPTLTKEEREQLDLPFTVEEFTRALNDMPNGKTPGPDGLSVRFYKTFKQQVMQPLFECLSEGLKETKLHRTARRGIINLIPKAKKDTRQLKFLRPITLCNIDFKILEKATANRIKTVITKLNGPQQKGFMKSRRISANIRKILDIITASNDTQEDGLIISVDFQKCFDNISFDAIIGCLKFFGFGTNFIDIIRTTYRDFTACIQNNGYFSDIININKGVRQGAPNSSYIFLLCAEMMALMLKQNQKIEGLPVGEMKYLLGQYADDMDTYIKASHGNVAELFNTLDAFYKISGFIVNYDKTSVYRVGSLRKTQAKCYVDKELHWTNDPFNVLGVIVGTEENDLESLNYDPIMIKAKGILDTWQKRHLSLMGKAMIINTLVASLFIHKMMVLRTVSKKLVKCFNKMILNFMWNNGTPKIATAALQNNKEFGGINLINLEVKDYALKISWINILTNDVELSNLAYHNLSPILKDNIWRCNLQENDVRKLFRSSFWTDVLEAWCKINFISEHEVQPESQILWVNSCIRINNTPVIWEKVIKSGLKYVHQIYENGSTISLRSAMNYGLTIMEFNSLVTAIPVSWRKWCRESSKQIKIKDDKNVYRYDTVKNDCYLSSKAYKTLTGNEKLLQTKCNKWSEDFAKTIQYEDYLSEFKDVYKVTNITKLRSFQYRMLHRSTITNIQLKKWGITDSDKCNFCKEEKETVLHTFVFCPEVAKLWIEMERYMYNYSNRDITFDIEAVICNKFISQPVWHIKNLICLITKQYIYKQKCANVKLSHKQCQAYVRTIENNEKYYAIKRDLLKKHNRKWYPNEEQ